MSFFDVHHLIATYGYIGIFLIVFIESGVFFFLPGDSLLFTAGLVAATGDLRLSFVLILASVAGFLGNLVGYWIGSHVERLRKYGFFRTLLKDEHMTRAHTFFDERGRFAILLARFVPGIRTFTPWAAGLGRMKKRVFIEWSAFGALIWVMVMTLIGYFLGRAFPGLEKYLTPIILLILILSVLPAVFEWWRSRQPQSEE